MSGGLQELIERFGSYRPVAKPEPPCDTSDRAKKANKIRVFRESVATVAIVAGGYAPLDGFTPKTEMGERLKQVALAFMASDLWRAATELGWTEAELFGVYNHAELDVINRRADAKGLVPFVALAVWPNTKIERLEAGYALVVTGGGGAFTFMKRHRPNSIPFWQVEAL